MSWAEAVLIDRWKASRPGLFETLSVFYHLSASGNWRLALNCRPYHRQAHVGR